MTATPATSSQRFGEDGVARLEVQGAALAPATRMILAEAGIRPGMRVLDLGCGRRGVHGPAWSDPEAPWSASTARRMRWPGPGCGPDSAGLAQVRPLLAPGQVGPTLAEFLA